MNKMIPYFLIGLLLLPQCATAREQLRIVGSSTVFPFVAAAAEQFGRNGGFRTPIVEATGTGGGIKNFCQGIGERYPDMVNASRPIKDSELALCKMHGVEDITELRIGYDGIVLANARESLEIKLTRRDLFLALARDVPRDGALVPNYFRSWQQISPDLPDIKIEVYGPPPSSGTRDAFVELVMDQGCTLVPEMHRFAKNAAEEKALCGALREDGGFVEAGEDDNLIVQKLINNPDALGVFGYSFLENNAALVKANPIDGVTPTYDAIINGEYHVARSLFVYVKNGHLGIIKGLREFAVELTSDAAVGESGYLILKGLLPLRAQDHKDEKAKASTL